MSATLVYFAYTSIIGRKSGYDRSIRFNIQNATIHIQVYRNTKKMEKEEEEEEEEEECYREKGEKRLQNSGTIN